MANKITKMDNFKAITVVLKDAGRTDLVAVMEHEMELLTKKNSYKSDKPTKAQVENANLKHVIAEQMVAGKAYTITDMQKSFEGLADLSNQRVSAIVRQMVESGEVVKTIDKRKSYFSLA